MRLEIAAAVIVSLLGCTEPPDRKTYKYASPASWDICVDVCPGDDCPCIIGADDTWYINPEIAE